MFDGCLFVNYNIALPVLSRLQPDTAYAAIRRMGNAGKPLGSYTSFLHDFPAAPVGMAALKKYLGVEQPEAELIMRSYYATESRWELENRWMESNRTGHIDRIFDPESFRSLRETIQRHGPCILLTAHTMNFYAYCWALQNLGIKVALIMLDPRIPDRANRVLQTRNIRAVDALRASVPVIFANPGGTIRRASEAIRNGYSVVLLIDVPSRSGNGTPVSMFGADFLLPSGWLRIYEETGVPVITFFPYSPSVGAPYQIETTPPVIPPLPFDLQQYARGLERVALRAPASWFGWFLLRDMLYNKKEA